MYKITGYDIAHSNCNHSTFFRLLICFFKTVVPDDDEDHQPFHEQTPPTPPVPHEISPGPSPPPSPRPVRQRAMTQLRPVSIPNIVFDMAGHDPIQKIAAFNRHYMPDGQPADEASSLGNGEATAENWTDSRGRALAPDRFGTQESKTLLLATMKGLAWGLN
jgi:hypothetical protein